MLLAVFQFHIKFVNNCYFGFCHLKVVKLEVFSRFQDHWIFRMEEPENKLSAVFKDPLR